MAYLPAIFGHVSEVKLSIHYCRCCRKMGSCCPVEEETGAGASLQAFCHWKKGLYGLGVAESHSVCSSRNPQSPGVLPFPFKGCFCSLKHAEGVWTHNPYLGTSHEWRRPCCCFHQGFETKEMDAAFVQLENPGSWMFLSSLCHTPMLASGLWEQCFGCHCPPLGFWFSSICWDLNKKVKLTKCQAHQMSRYYGSRSVSQFQLYVVIITVQQ